MKKKASPLDKLPSPDAIRSRLVALDEEARILRKLMRVIRDKERSATLIGSVSKGGERVA